MIPMPNLSILPRLAWAIAMVAMGCDDAENDAKSTDETTSDSTGDDDTETFDPNTDIDTALGTAPSETLYEGFEEQYILTAEDDPEDVCRIRYELHAVAEPSVPCANCEWDVVLERRNPTVVVNIDHACENSELGLSEAAIAAQVNERVAYGFAEESVGHADILMRYNNIARVWEGYTVSNWESATSRFRYNRRDGMCSFAGTGRDTASTQGICGISGEATVTPADKPSVDESSDVEEFTF